MDITQVVINRNGTKINFDASIELMDDEIRENIAYDGTDYTNQAFFAAYEIAHEKEFGQEWEVSKINPVY